MSELLGLRVPELWDELRGVIGKSNSIELAPSDQNLAIGKNDAVVKGSRKCHGANDVDSWGGVWFVDGDDMGIGSTVCICSGPEQAASMTRRGRRNVQALVCSRPAMEGNENVNYLHL